jgi:hypothetical protein
MDSPTAFAVESVTNRSATLTWVDTADAVFYRLYFGTSSDFLEASLFCPIMQGVGRAIIGALASETEYHFWILAEDADGELSDEETTTATTAATTQDFEVSAVENAIYEWAVDNFGDYAVVWDKQDGTRPGRPFVMLGMNSSPNFGGQDHMRGSRICGNRMLMVSVNVYADDEVMQKTLDLRTSLFSPAVIEKFDLAGIGIGEINGVTNISELLDNRTWEKRAQFDFGVIVASDKQFDAGQIDGIDLNTTLMGGN